jgi:NAD(P)-dependent dehydrogenase (short-subunit alcohol dehydrogenase family)
VSDGVSKAVLVTGCSTGIGRATAERLARRGWTVYASARKPEAIEDLAGAGCTLVTLDVADGEFRRAAIAEVESGGASRTSARWAAGSPFPAAARTTPASTRWKR